MEKYLLCNVKWEKLDTELYVVMLCNPDYVNE